MNYEFLCTCTLFSLLHVFCVRLLVFEILVARVIGATSISRYSEYVLHFKIQNILLLIGKLLSLLHAYTAHMKVFCLRAKVFLAFPQVFPHLRDFGLTLASLFILFMCLFLRVCANFFAAPHIVCMIFLLRSFFLLPHVLSDLHAVPISPRMRSFFSFAQVFLTAPPDLHAV